MAKKIIVVGENRIDKKETNLKEAVESEIEAYLRRPVLNEPFDFREVNQNGSWPVDLESWDGCEYPPIDLPSKGHFQSWTSGPDTKLTFTAKNGMVAVWEKIDDVWQIDEENNPGGWIYLPSQPLPEYDEEGNQQFPVGTIGNGKFLDVQQRAIKKGLQVLGELPEPSVLSGIPLLGEGNNPKAFNGDYVYQVSDWSDIVDGPSNLAGAGYVKISYYNGRVTFEAYSYLNNQKAYALIPELNGTMGAWEVGTDSFYTKESIDFLLNLYAKVEHQHDERYYQKWEIIQELAKYMPIDRRFTIDEIYNLTVVLAGKLDASAFNNAYPGDVLARGEEGGTYISIDTTDPYITATVLTNAKEGDAYTFFINDDMIIWPRDVVGKRIIATCARKWITFSGAIVGTTGAGILINGTAVNNGLLAISMDMCYRYTENGEEKREQRILYIDVAAAAAVITIPADPLSLVATAISKNQINLTFDGTPVTNESGFNVYRSTSPGSGYTLIGTTGPNEHHYEDKTCGPNTRYYYRVKAANSAGESGYIQDDDTTPAEPVEDTGGLYARYYDSIVMNATNPVENRVDQTINFSTTGTAPSAFVTNGAYMVRWSGYIKPPVAGNFQFSFGTNAQTRIWFGGQLVVDAWTNSAVTTYAFSKQIAANQQVPIVIEYLQKDTDTIALLFYNSSGTDIVVPTLWLIPEPTLGEAIPAPVLTAIAISDQTVRLTWSFALGVDPDQFETFGGIGNSPALPLLTNVSNDGSLRTVDINGLPSNTTFFFENRAVIDGRFSPQSNRASATTQPGTGGPGPGPQKPNSAAPVVITRVNANTVSVSFQDNNTGTEAETYEFRFSEYGTQNWKYLTAASGLSDSEGASDLSRTYPAGISKVLNLSNDFFINRRMIAAVRVHLDSLQSDWINGIEDVTTLGGVKPEIIPVVGFNIVKKDDGLYYDTEPSEYNGFHAFYMPEDSYKSKAFFNANGTPKKFQGVAFPSNAFMSVRKLMLLKQKYPNTTEWKTWGWQSNIGSSGTGNILSNALTIVRTWEEGVIVNPPETSTRATSVDYAATYPTVIIPGIMSWASWKTAYVKACVDAAKQAGFKCIHLSFSPFKVWNNYTSPGAIDMNNLQWNWTQVNDLVNYVCNVKGMKLGVRLWNDMSDFSLRHYPANNNEENGTEALYSAWLNYFDRGPDGSIYGLKIDNITTPPWQFYFKFLAAFKQQFDSYWQTGKILLWEFAFNRNQEASPDPNNDNLPMPTYAQYVEKTGQMKAIGTQVLSIMAGWDDSVWNCGAFYNWGLLIKQISMGYMSFADGFKGIRGNHGSDWSLTDFEFYDMLGYTRSCQNPADVASTPVLNQRFFLTEYFRRQNVDSADQMATALELSLKNGCWAPGFIFDNGIFDPEIPNNAPSYILAVGAALAAKNALNLPRATNFSIKGITNYSLKQAFDSNSGMLSQWKTAKGSTTTQKQKALIGMNPTLQLSIVSIDFLFTQDNPITNDINFYIKAEDGELSQNNQESQVGTGANKVIPNSSSIADAFVIAPAGKSTGNNVSLAFYRFGINCSKLTAAYPSKVSFKFGVYARKNPSLNSGSNNGFTVRFNMFSDAAFQTSALGNGVDYQRTGGTSIGAEDVSDSVSGTSFVKVGEIIFNKLANIAYYQNL